MHEHGHYPASEIPSGSFVWTLVKAILGLRIPTRGFRRLWFYVLELTHTNG